MENLILCAVKHSKNKTDTYETPAGKLILSFVETRCTPNLILDKNPKLFSGSTDTQLARGRGRRSPLPFLKIEDKCPDFAKKSVLFVCVYGLNSHLKM